MVNRLNFDSKEDVDQKREGFAMCKQHRQLFPKTAKSITIGLSELIHGKVRGLMNVYTFSGRSKILS